MASNSFERWNVLSNGFSKDVVYLKRVWQIGPMWYRPSDLNAIAGNHSPHPTFLKLGIVDSGISPPANPKMFRIRTGFQAHGQQAIFIEWITYVGPATVMGDLEKSCFLLLNILDACCTIMQS